MGRGEVDCVIVGADRIAANGDTANKIGTYTLAVLAMENGIPFYVAAPTTTIDPSLATGDEIPIEQRSAEEVTHIQGVSIAPEGTHRHHHREWYNKRALCGETEEVSVRRISYGRRIQYLGESGITSKCLLAISSILNSGCLPESVTITTLGPEHHPSHVVEKHLFLFWNWGHFKLTIVPSGFASGYSGEGPMGFSLALCMIRSKQIPFYHMYVNETEFETINKGRILQVGNPLYQRIKVNAQRLPCFYHGWILPGHEELLTRGQLWRCFTWYSEPQSDWITEAIGDIDLYYPEVGKTLRIAVKKLNEVESIKEWQTVGILLRDAWIELIQKICHEKGVDLSGIGHDQVSGMLGKLYLSEKIERFMKSVFDFSLHIQHNRKIDRSVTRAALAATVLSMQMLLYKECGCTLKLKLELLGGRGFMILRG